MSWRTRYYQLLDSLERRNKQRQGREPRDRGERHRARQPNRSDPGRAPGTTRQGNTPVRAPRAARPGPGRIPQVPRPAQARMPRSRLRLPARSR